MVAHDLHLILFPAFNGFLDQDLTCRGQLKALRHDLNELFLVVRDAAAGAAHGEARTQYAGIAGGFDNREGVLNGVRITRARHFETQVGHGFVEQLAVLAALDGIKVASDHLDAVALEYTGLRQLDGGIEARLATQGGQQGIGVLALDDLLNELRRDGLHVGAVGEARVRHDGRGIRVDQHDLVSVFFEYLTGLSTRVVELACLANHDRSGSNNQNPLNIGTLGHASSPPLQNSSRATGRP